MAKMTLKDLSLEGKKVLMRVDFNVPMKEGEIGDDTRIKGALPSIQYILNHGGALILMSHMGRPKGTKEKELSLAPCATRLSQLLNRPVQMATDCIGSQVKEMVAHLQSGQVLLLENLRYHLAEEKPELDPTFAAKLAELGDCFINDAFGSAHRSHSSTALITKYFPDQAAMGFLLEKEIQALSTLTHPNRPFSAIIGGAKIKGKIGVLRKLIEVVDELYIGGGMAFTFLKAKGVEIGNSLCEDAQVALDILKIAPNKIHLPLDIVIAKEQEVKTVDLSKGIPPQWQGMDIGPKTVADWSQKLRNSATIFWNGPVGVFETPQFAEGTRAIADALANSSAKVIVGGGDTVAAVQQMGFGAKMDHLSTGGGASLEFIELGHLPGIDALTDIN